MSEPCQSDVVEPEPAVYVAPPPAPALLELPPVVQRKKPNQPDSISKKLYLIYAF